MEGTLLCGQERAIHVWLLVALTGEHREGERKSEPSTALSSKQMILLKRLRVARGMVLSFPTTICTYTGIFTHIHPSVKG